MHLSFTGERYVPELRGQIYYEHFHRYSLALDLARGKDVLDISCGEGYGAAALALVARSVVGMDIDQQSVRHAAARYTAMNLDFRVGDCCDIPAGDATFDVIVSFETIEHLTGQERMLSEFKRILRPDGRLVISSPNKLVYSDSRAYSNPFHVRELYFHEFRDMLRSFFPEVRIFGQRVFAASAVHPLRGAADDTRWLGPSTVAENTIGALPDPEYFVAVCSRRYGDALPDMSSVYLDPRDELLADITSGGLAGAAERGALDAGPSIGMLPAGDQRSLPAPTAATVRTMPAGASLQEQIVVLEQMNTALAQRNEALEKMAGNGRRERRRHRCRTRPARERRAGGGGPCKHAVARFDAARGRPRRGARGRRAGAGGATPRTRGASQLGPDRRTTAAGAAELR